MKRHRPKATRPAAPHAESPTKGASSVEEPEQDRDGRDAAGPELSRRKRALFPLVIALLWIALFGIVEGGLRFTGVGNATDLFLEVEEGVRIDNSFYPARFFPAADARNPARPSNLFTVEKSPGTMRIFMVGGSTAQGFPYQRGHSFAQIAKEALAAQGVALEVINLGNSAVSSYYLREVLQDIGRYDPDIVVVYAGHNEYYGSPSLFTGGTHLTRLAILELRRFRTFQLLEAAVVRLTGRRAAEGGNLMETRFAEHLHPLDPERDAEVAELFVRNLRAGAEDLIEDGVPLLVFSPVSNLISMPPFRSTGGGDLYRAALAELEAGGEWDRRRWEEIRDQDEAPFRARSALVRRLEEYVGSEASMHWIPTPDEMEAREGFRAFSDDFFIDHLHLNFEGQSLLGEILAERIAETLFPTRADLVSGVQEFFSDPAGVRQAVRLTDFWEFSAYSTVVGLLEQEPFRSMPIPKANPLTPERIRANPLYADAGLLDVFRQVTGSDNLLHVTLEYYYRSGNREEWIRNLNAYLYLFPGDPTTHLVYGIGLLSDDPQNNLDMAASYFRQAFLLSRRDEAVREAIRSEFDRIGISHLWPAFEINYLR